MEKSKFLEAGEIVSTHGVRGEVKILPWTDDVDFLRRFKTLYINETPYAVKHSFAHKGCMIALFEGIDDVNAAMALKGRTVCFARADAHLPDNHFFIQDLIGCRVFDADAPDQQYGVLTQVSRTGANDVWHVTDGEGREFLLPAIPPVVIDTDIDNERIVIRPLKGIIDDAD